MDLGDDTTEQEVRSSLAGHWVASLSSEAFVTGPKLLRLDIDSEGQGTLSIGAVTLDPPTDPSVGFPPEAQADAVESSTLQVHLYDGVAYDVQNVTASSAGLRFEVDGFQAFKVWCELQTPISTSRGYHCRDQWDGKNVDRTGGQKQCFLENPDTHETQSEDCLAISLCNLDPTRGCRCTESECSANDGGQQSVVTFDLALDEASDTLRGGHTYTDVGVTRAGSIVEFTRQ